MNYLSVCSGIEAASCAWEHLNWNPVGFSEIEKFPARVLQHHYPNVTNFGDMTNYKEWKINGTIGLLVGGTPCQSFSVAGFRDGLKDPRGNLMLTYVGILDHFRPKWFIWENVPGVLSSNEGRDFGSLLGAVADIGYGFAYRVLDAQYFGVAQRRRRVFVVGNLGDWRGPAKVLFESGCLSRDSPPSREKRKEITSRSGIGVEITGPLAARRFAETDGLSENSAQMVVMPDTVGTLDLECGGGGNGGKGYLGQDKQAFTISTVQDQQIAVSNIHAFNSNARPDEMNISPINQGLTCSQNAEVVQQMAVRRLTPVECERLQGFPDQYTDILPGGKPTPDGPRYKALGNSMAVPVMRWIGERIDAVEKGVL